MPARTLHQIEIDLIRERVLHYLSLGCGKVDAKKLAAAELGVGIATIYRRLNDACYHSDNLSTTCPQSADNSDSGLAD